MDPAISPGEQDKSRFDPAEVARLYSDIARKSGELLTQAMERQSGAPLKPIADELGISKAFFEAWSRMLTDPVRLAENQMKLWQDYWSLWQSSMMKLFGKPAAPVAAPPQGDRRFKHQDW